MNRDGFDTRTRGAFVATAALAIAGLVAGCGGSGEPPPPQPPQPQKLVILHTNDIHSHLMGMAPEADYTPATTADDATRGGFARLASGIGAAKAEAAAAGTPVLTLDAGDFMMGTLFELLGTRAASELALMQAIGYDATTIGNHELDWTPRGLAGILQGANTSGVHVPIVASNIIFNDTDPRDDDLKAIADLGAIQPKLVKTVGSLKVGIFGLLGHNAAQVTPQAAPLAFEDIAVAAGRMVKELRETDKVDVVIALSHSGIDGSGHGEDVDLAAAVDGIDVIVSGHTHDTLAAPKQVGRTLIVTAGSYGRFFGQLQLSITKAADTGGAPTVAMDDYKLVAVDDQIAADAATQTAVDAYIAGIDQALTGTGLSYKKVVAQTSADIPFPAHAEAPIGNLVTDAFRTVAATLQPSDPPVVAIEGNGQIRADVVKGSTGAIWFADLFRVEPDGIGPDGNPGYPLVTFYLNAKDLRAGLELDAAQEVVSNDFFLQVSGLKVSYDMARPLFGRVTAVAVSDANGSRELDLADTTTCYKVVTTNYVAGLLSEVASLTGGALSVVAKDRDCVTPVDPTIRFVDSNPAADGVQELKNWQALVGYVGGLPDTTGDGIPDVPAAYGTSQGRILAQQPLCVGTPPGSPLITDFSDATATPFGLALGSASGIPGGSYTYAAPALAAPSVSVVDTGNGGRALHVVAAPGTPTDVANAWSGLGLFFDSCVDASAYAGVKFTITGNVGNCGLTVAAGFAEDTKTINQPQGVCTSDPCYYPSTAVQTTGTVSVAFAQMAGGHPVTAVDSRSLLGIQWQLNAPFDGSCSADFTISDVEFITTLPPPLPPPPPPLCSGLPARTPNITGAPSLAVAEFGYAAPGLTGPTFSQIFASDGSLQGLHVSADPGTATDPTSAWLGVGIALPGCVDASAYRGVRFTIAGDLGTCALGFVAVSSEKSPVAWGGSCTEASCWSPSSARLPLGTSTVHFADLVGGSPAGPVDSARLMDLQWQLTVPSDGVTAPCNADFTITDVAFVND